jgi:hypothetical protein
MSEVPSRQGDVKPNAAHPARQPWDRPTVTKMEAADAELGTRATGPDGSFSVS